MGIVIADTPLKLAVAPVSIFAVDVTITSVPAGPEIGVIVLVVVGQLRSPIS
jgi:hypothetical protein